MSSKMIAIVCDGKEISYASNLLHLFQYKGETETFTSDMIADVSVEMYSVVTYMHTNISKKVIKIYVGDVQKVDLSYNKVFCQYGMTIMKSRAEFILKVDNKELEGHAYDEFISYANKKRKEYIDLEKDYMERINPINPNWIAKEFKPVFVGGLFGQKDKCKKKVHQQYDCAAFVLYLDIIRNEEI